MAELPYKGDDLAMVAIVPQDADGLAALETKLTGAHLQAWIGKLHAAAQRPTAQVQAGNEV